MKIYKTLSLLLLVGIILFAGCTAQYENQAVTKVTSTYTNAAEQTEYIIEITSAGFNPTVLRVKRGDTVTFVNKDSNVHWPASDIHPTHTVYDETSLSEHCPNTDGTAFDSCYGLQEEEKFSFKFDKSGSWKYHDHLNPNYIGTIVVE